MGLKFIDLPGAAEPKDYEEAVGSLVRRIREFPGVIGIIRFGSLMSPGISDIDLLVVFEDDTRCDLKPLERFPPGYAHLLSHGVDAMSWSFYRDTPNYTFWFNSKCIWGDAERLHIKPARSRDEEEALKIQTAIEYVITNYIDLTLQVSYGIIKLRAMLQHLKGLAYDLEFLDITSGPLHEAVAKLRVWMARWQERKPAVAELSEWIRSFYGIFTAFVKEQTAMHPVYVPLRASYSYTRNVELIPGASAEWRRSGLPLPGALFFLGRRYYNLQHRLNRWTFTFPMKHQAPEIVEKRFEYFRNMKRYNVHHFPGFSHLTTGFSEKFD